MKKKITILSLAMLCFNLKAQAENMIKNDMDRYASKIDSIVSSEKSKMNTEMDIWKQKLENKEISDDEYSNAKREIASKFEREINDKISSQRKHLDSITMAKAKESIFSKKTADSCSAAKRIVVRMNAGDINRKKSGDLLVSYSMGNLTNASGFDLFNKNSGMKIGNTHSVEVYYRRTHQLGKESSPFYIHYGLAYRTDTYMPKGNRVFSEENEQLVLNDFTEGRLKRSKLRNVYLLAPLEFSWVMNPSSDSWKFRLGLGAYAGINTRSIIKVKYYNENDKFKKYKDVIDNGVNPYIAGGKLSLSFGSFTLFVKKDFTPAFDEKAQLNYKNNIQFGVVLSNISLR